MKKLLYSFIAATFGIFLIQSNSHAQNYNFFAEITKKPELFHALEWVDIRGIVSDREVYTYPEGEDFFQSDKIAWRAEQWDTVYRSFHYPDELGQDTLVIKYVKSTGEWTLQFRTETTYLPNGEVGEILYKSWINEEWVLTRRRQNFYRSDDQDSLLVIDVYQDGEWQPNTIKNFYYDQYDRLDSTLTVVYSEGEWTHHTKSTFFHEGFLIYETAYRWRNGEWEKSLESETNYTPLGVPGYSIEDTYLGGELQNRIRKTWRLGRGELGDVLVSYVERYYDFEDSSYVMKLRDIYTYDDQIRLVKIETTLYEEVNEWRNQSETEYEYAYGQEIGPSETIDYYYNSGNDSERNEYVKNTYEYDSNGSVTQWDRYLMDSEWELNTRRKFYYNDMDSLVRLEYFHDQDGELVNIYIQEYTYNDRDLLAGMLVYRLNNGEMEPFSGYEYIYYENGRPDSTIFYIFNEDGKREDSWIMNYDYGNATEGETSTTMTRINIRDGEYLYSSQTVYTYKDGDIIGEISYNWDADLESWVADDVYTFIYENGNMIREEQSLNGGSSNRRFTAQYDEDGDPVEILQLRWERNEQPANYSKELITYLEPNAVAESPAESAVRIYPNPASE
ncbi:MAG: hypothetical protein ACLFQX_09585, partial [Candidatus Kapaibacterium sp.]